MDLVIREHFKEFRRTVQGKIHYSIYDIGIQKVRLG